MVAQKETSESTVGKKINPQSLAAHYLLTILCRGRLQAEPQCPCHDTHGTRAAPVLPSSWCLIPWQAAPQWRDSKLQDFSSRILWWSEHSLPPDSVLFAKPFGFFCSGKPLVLSCPFRAAVYWDAPGFPWEFCSWESSWSTSSSLNTDLCSWSTDLAGPVASSGAQSQAVTNVTPLQFLLLFTVFIRQGENALLGGTERHCFIIPQKLA